MLTQTFEEALEDLMAAHSGDDREEVLSGLELASYALRDSIAQDDARYENEDADNMDEGPGADD